MLFMWWEGTHLPLAGMCPQFSLQVMMGVGTPTAWQEKVTVSPRAALTASWGGFVTDGGAGGGTRVNRLNRVLTDAHAFHFCVLVCVSHVLVCSFTCVNSASVQR